MHILTLGWILTENLLGLELGLGLGRDSDEFSEINKRTRLLGFNLDVKALPEIFCLGVCLCDKIYV